MPEKAKISRVEQIIRMMAYFCIKDLKTLNEQVLVLDRFGFSSQQIADLCEVAEGSVRNARVQNKRINKLDLRKLPIKKKEKTI
jgi:DNA-directed RNA polymerase specialized sigma24 family protein